MQAGLKLHRIYSTFAKSAMLPRGVGYGFNIPVNGSPHMSRDFSDGLGATQVESKWPASIEGQKEAEWDLYQQGKHC